MRRILCTALAAVLAGCASAAEAAERLVRTQDEFRRAVEQAKPGDDIVLASGEWRDFQILLRGRGATDSRRAAR